MNSKQKKIAEKGFLLLPLLPAVLRPMKSWQWETTMMWGGGEMPRDVGEAYWRMENCPLSFLNWQNLAPPDMVGEGAASASPPHQFSSHVMWQSLQQHQLTSAWKMRLILLSLWPQQNRGLKGLSCKVQISNSKKIKCFAFYGGVSFRLKLFQKRAPSVSRTKFPIH